MHAHAFPDALASRAVAHLAAKAGVVPALDGTVGALLASMDRAGIAAAAICSIATEPSQFRAILRWSASIASDRIVPFVSVHPGSSEALEQVREAAAAGFRGVKLHPEYQDFFVDDPGLAPLYRELEAQRLVALFHAGHDIGFPDSDRAAPARFLSVHRAFPGLRLVASHLGGFRRWREVADCLVGSGVWLDTSYTLGHVPGDLLREILLGHRADRLLFGTDSPWVDQRTAIDEFRALALPPALEARILGGNARELLGI